MTIRSKETEEPLRALRFNFISFLLGSLIFQANVSMGFPSNAFFRSARSFSHRSISTVIGRGRQCRNWGLLKHLKRSQYDPFCYKHTCLLERTRLFPEVSHNLTELDDDSDFINEQVSGSIDLEIEEEDSPLSKFTPGSNAGFYVVKQYKTATKAFDLDLIKSLVDEDLERLELTPQNISVPVALMLLDQDEFPSKSRARKACRKANIMIHRGPLEIDAEGEEVFDPSKCERARVGDRVFPGDVLAKQVRMGSGEHPIMNHKKPPFELPVVYEDDHFAIVDKPAGVVVYAHRQGGHGVMTVRAALPFTVRPPASGTYSTLRRPQPVHRLDKPTSGLLLIAKTKPAMVHLSHQFRDRKVKKTYVAVVNGIPDEPQETSISSLEAYAMGVDVDPSSKDQWQLIDYPLDEKSAVTIWRSLKYAKSLKAKQNYCTLVELKPKTGRYHQLRRHMALVAERPLVGDSTYDGGGDAMQLRERGLFLSSNKVILEHPFYNSEEGRKIFHQLSEEQLATMKGLEETPDGKVIVSVSNPIPDKFESFMTREEDRYERLHVTEPNS